LRLRVLRLGILGLRILGLRSQAAQASIASSNNILGLLETALITLLLRDQPPPRVHFALSGTYLFPASPLFWLRG
jgi:hypothetical protein